MNNHEKPIDGGAADGKPGDTPAMRAKFEGVCARIAANENVGVRAVEERAAIAELNHNYNLGEIQARVKQIIKDNKQHAKEARLAPDSDVEEMVDKFNKEYAIVSLKGDVKVVREFVNKKGWRDFELMTTWAFETWVADQPKIVTQRGNAIVERSAASVWLAHPNRRKHEDGMIFEPGVKEQPILPGERWPRYYNIWQCWGVEPSEEGSCDLFKAHLRDVYCCGDEELYTHTWNHFAHMFQKPMEKPTTCNAAIGPPGIGKSIVGDILGILVGPGYVTVTADLMNGNFNGHLKAAILVQADEALYAHDKRVAAKIKNNITCKQREINDKGDKVYMVNAYDRLFCTAERRDGLPVEKDDRRFAITEPLATHQEDTEYFGAMIKQLENGGYQRLMHEFLATDLSKFNPYKCPKTQARARAVQEVADVEVSFLIDMATTLECWNYNDGDGFIEETYIFCSTLREQFFKYAGTRRLNCRATETKLGMAFAKAGITGGHKQRLKQSTFINGELKPYGFRANAYLLPDPQVMRDKMIAEFGLPADCFKDAEKILRRPEGQAAPTLAEVDRMTKEMLMLELEAANRGAF